MIPVVSSRTPKCLLQQHSYVLFIALALCIALLRVCHTTCTSGACRLAISSPSSATVVVLAVAFSLFLVLLLAGRLARAFAAGYYCSDERELLRTCGVRLSH